jgi:hypothetical protein
MSVCGNGDVAPLPSMLKRKEGNASRKCMGLNIRYYRAGIVIVSFSGGGLLLVWASQKSRALQSSTLLAGSHSSPSGLLPCQQTRYCFPLPQRCSSTIFSIKNSCCSSMTTGPVVEAHVEGTMHCHFLGKGVFPMCGRLGIGSAYVACPG